MIIPPNPGVTSAMGCMLVDVQHDMTRMYLKSANDADPAVVEQAYLELEEEGRARLEAEGVPAEHMTFQRFMDMRYQGQWRSMSVAVGRPIGDMAASIEGFQLEYSREHNYRRDDAPVEIYRLQVRAVGITPKPEIARQAPTPDAPLVATEQRMVLFDESRRASPDARLSSARRCRPGPRSRVPPSSISSIPPRSSRPNTRATVDEWMNIRIDIMEV